jgi:hypothetical protein
MADYVIVVYNHSDANPMQLTLNGTLIDTWDNTAGSGFGFGKIWTTNPAITFQGAYKLNGVNMGVDFQYDTSATFDPGLILSGLNELDLQALNPYTSGIGGVIIHQVNSADGSIIQTLFGDDSHIDDQRTLDGSTVYPKACLFTVSDWVCQRIVTSSWITKVCFHASYGVRVTFKDRHGKLFTALYPGTSSTDYDALVAAASKGHWIHQFYYKKRPYVVWPVSP